MSKIVNFEARSYPSPVTSVGMVQLAMLTRAVDGYRVYVGIVPDTSCMDPNYTDYCKWVKDHGAKQRFGDAVTFFPGLNQKEYAR